MEREPSFSSGTRPLRHWLPDDGALPWSVSSVETFPIDVLEAALLHRDAPAERGRLVTRRFVAGWAKQWFARSEFDERSEILCAQVIVSRFGSPIDAALSEADGWNELHAGAAEFIERQGAVGPLRFAIVREGGRTHALSFRREGDTTISSCASHVESTGAMSAALILLTFPRVEQNRGRTPSSPSGR